MFFISNLRTWRWRRHFSHSRRFKRRAPTQAISAAENIRLRKHQLTAAHEWQKVQRNYFLERHTFL